MDREPRPASGRSPWDDVVGSSPGARSPARDAAPPSLRPVAPTQPASQYSARPRTYVPRSGGGRVRYEVSPLERWGKVRVMAAALAGCAVIVLGGLLLHGGSAPVAAAARPTAAPTPPPPTPETPTAVGTPAPTPAAVPTPVGSIPGVTVPGSPSPMALTYGGTYAVAADGSVRMSCDRAQVGGDTCSWPIAVGLGNPLDVGLTWSGSARLGIDVTAVDGSRLGHADGVTGSLTVSVVTVPAEVIVTVEVMDGTAATFQLGIANHR